MSTSTKRARTLMKRLPVFATLAAASVTAAITVGAGSASADVGCLDTSLSQDGHVLTAKVVGGPVSSPVDATGCDIGVYNPDADIAGAEVYGAKYYGVVVDGSRDIDVTGAKVHDIGDNPPDGMQY